MYYLVSVMSLTLLYIAIARSVSDVAISKRDSFASLGMTHGRLFMGQDAQLGTTTQLINYSTSVGKANGPQSLIDFITILHHRGNVLIYHLDPCNISMIPYPYLS
jgi:hypothetical protein